MAARLRDASSLLVAVCLIVSNAYLTDRAHAQAVMDEARQAGRVAQSFAAADEDYFQAMDGGVALTPDEVKGRNTWIVWTGGNDRLWDKLTNLTYGTFDLLKILSSYSGLKYSRDNRWNYFGLVNEPCFKGNRSRSSALWTVARPAQHGLPARSVCERAEIPGRLHRGARQEYPGRVLLRLPDRDRRVAPLPQSRLRSSRRRPMGC